MKNRAYVGYEIFPDRFNPSEKKANTLDWNRAVRLMDDGSHQYDFYGGDLKGIEKKIGYLKELKLDFLYLTPIFQAGTNHRYDCTDFFAIDPMLGTDEELSSLIGTLHDNGMRLVLDGVFNHIGSEHKWFTKRENRELINTENDEIRYWAGNTGLPELNLDNAKLREILWNGNDSVIHKWTALGVDDWRLDCAYDVGYDYLRELTTSLKRIGDHQTIGEIWSYPKKWISDGVLDGIMNYYFRELVKSVIENRLKGKTAVKAIARTVKDCSVEGLFRCWNVMSSHDTPRIKRDFGEKWQLAAFLQFTLPGSPLIYYGEELGLETDGDPFCRQPMPWELAKTDNGDQLFYRKLIDIFQGNPAINSGYFGTFEYDNQNLIAFSRYTENIAEYRVIIVNPADSEQEYQLISDESSLMNGTQMIDEFSDSTCKVFHSMLYGSIEANSFQMFKVSNSGSTYSPYKRIY
ncbi:MAG TPA: alpha-amylase family glycosyl hydrolase [Thermotogota bacterium]|nr:alpha-amylase family glycosyl hydrolase [Thermotogota bacterium]